MGSKHGCVKCGKAFHNLLKPLAQPRASSAVRCRCIAHSSATHRGSEVTVSPIESLRPKAMPPSFNPAPNLSHSASIPPWHPLPETLAAWPLTTETLRGSWTALSKVVKVSQGNDTILAHSKQHNFRNDFSQTIELRLCPIVNPHAASTLAVLPSAVDLAVQRNSEHDRVVMFRAWQTPISSLLRRIVVPSTHCYGFTRPSGDLVQHAHPDPLVIATDMTLSIAGSMAWHDNARRMYILELTKCLPALWANDRWDTVATALDLRKQNNDIALVAEYITYRYAPDAASVA